MKKGLNTALNLSALVLVALDAAVASAGPGGAGRPADSKYRVFCANSKVEVEQRTLEQQKNARGSNVCMMAEFDSLSDAESYAEKRGGKGAECSCR